MKAYLLMLCQHPNASPVQSPPVVALAPSPKRPQGIIFSATAFLPLTDPDKCAHLGTNLETPTIQMP